MSKPTAVPGPAWFEPVNLDDATVDPTELKQAGEVYRLYSQYASNKAAAMVHRKKGFVGVAEHLEQVAQTVHAQLPDWAKW